MMRRSGYKTAREKSVCVSSSLFLFLSPYHHSCEAFTPPPSLSQTDTSTPSPSPPLMLCIISPSFPHSLRQYRMELELQTDLQKKPHLHFVNPSIFLSSISPAVTILLLPSHLSLLTVDPYDTFLRLLALSASSVSPLLYFF